MDAFRCLTNSLCVPFHPCTQHNTASHPKFIESSSSELLCPENALGLVSSTCFIRVYTPLPQDSVLSYTCGFL